jgi:hypothetical protein
MKDDQIKQGQNDAWILHFIVRINVPLNSLSEGMQKEIRAYKNTLSESKHDIFDFIIGDIDIINSKDMRVVDTLRKIAKYESTGVGGPLRRIYLDHING